MQYLNKSEARSYVLADLRTMSANLVYDGVTNGAHANRSNKWYPGAVSLNVAMPVNEPSQ